MTEDEARSGALDGVPRETARAIEAYVAMLRMEAERQNLVSRTTLDHLWERHILDSTQLCPLAPDATTPWVDLGSGAGLPGLVVAALSKRPVILIEPRAKRCQFLRDAADQMGVGDRVTIVQSRAETAETIQAGVISARAVSALPALFAMGLRHSTAETVWLLPKGRSVAEEVAAARTSWHARIELVPSLTDSDAAIVVASDVRPKKGKRA